MLTLSLIKNSGGAAKYYAKEDGYYLSEVDAKDASFWWGEGASRLNLNGKVEEKDLQKLLAGYLPNGATVGLQKDGATNHRPGYDLCFHAPKSVSILALDGEDKRFYNAHLEAVKETLKFIERDAAQSKVVKNDTVSFERTKNLTVALVRHTTSRELDLHLHHHALVINATQRSDNEWRALASSKTNNKDHPNGFTERVHSNQIYYGLIYKSALANKVKALGCELEIVGNHGMWEIKGVPQEARDIMSKRRQQIEERIAELNYKSLKAADIASLDTREKKPENIKLAEVKQAWRAELASVGFSSKDFIESLGKNKAEQNRSEPSDAGNNSESAKQAVQDAVDHLSQYNLKLDYAKIIAQALEFSIGDSNHKSIVNAITESVKNGKLIPLDKLDSMFVTKNLIETEKTIMDLVDKSKAANTTICLKDNSLNNIPNSESKDLAIKTLQVNQRLNLVQHNLLDSAEFNSAVLNLAEASGKTVHILLPNRMMANDINENIKRRPSNLWQWLASLGKPEIGQCIAGFKHEYQEEINLPLLRLRQNKDVVIVNSAEALGCSDMQTILELTEKTGAKVIFLQDINARQGFTAGNPIQTLKQAGIETFKFSTEAAVVTKCTPELSAIKDQDARTTQLVRAYALKEDKERSRTIIFLSSKDQLKPVNTAVRAELKNQGRLTGEEHNLQVLTPIYMSKPESTIASQYSKDMIIRFYDENHTYEDWSIKSIDKAKNKLQLESVIASSFCEAIQKNINGLPRPIKNIGLAMTASRLNKQKKFKEFDPKQETNSMFFKKECLQIATGDKLIATANMHELGIKNSTQLVVQKVSDNHVELLSNAKTFKINLSGLNSNHFQYDYATTLSKHAKKPSQHVLADIKAHALDKQTMSALTNCTTESLTIFTDNAEIAQKRFSHIPVKLTATEALLDSSQIDRCINNQTVPEIKSDIAKAISGLSAKPEVKPETKAVDFALEKIISHNAAFTHKELIAEALTYVLKEELLVNNKAITHNDIMNVIEEKHKSGELVMGRYFDDGTRWTTKKILELERSIIAGVQKGQDKLTPLLAQKTNPASNLTQDQKNACDLITTTKDQFIIIQGYAGTGKTTMFSHVQDMLKIKGTTENKPVEMLALAPTHRAVKELKSVGIQAQTLKNFLIEEQKDSVVVGNTASKLDNKLIVLDEASMVSNQDFAEFLNIIENTKAHCVLSGDIAQHIAIGSGKPFEIIQKANILKTVCLREIVRQKNLNLKSAVESTINKDYQAAFKKIESENPQQHIARIKPDSLEAAKDAPQLDFFSNLKTSIVEIDNNKLKAGEKTLEAMVADDFLSRTQKVQDQTAVIVHANRDRKIITDFIRTGLKDQGRIAKTGVEANCLVPKGLTEAEHKSLQSYNQGDVVKLGRKYYHVMASCTETKSLFLKDETGKTKYFYPEKYADKNNVELYEHTKAELSSGDTIRLTKTDKERELYANFEYTVTRVNNKRAILESKDTKQKIALNHKELKDAHWDYAQTVTGYGIQGASKTYAIDFEVSYRKNLANQRSFYIGESRAIEHLLIYTDNKARLLNRILGNKGDKYAALEIINDPINNESNHSNKIAATTRETKNLQEKLSHESYDAKKIKQSLNNFTDSFIERFLGRPNEKLSSATEWRYGSKGSLVINITGGNRGFWHNFETGESGDLLTLIQKETGLSFRESLKYAASLTGEGCDANKPAGAFVKNSSDKIHDQEVSKTAKYAKQLAAESIPIAGTIVEKYLKARGIENTDSQNIRYHPKVYTGKNEAQKYLPAMIAVGRDKDGQVQCAQATYLDPNKFTKADLEVKKRTYASPAGAAVLLHGSATNKNSKTQMTFIAEGIETGLSIRDAVKSDVVVTLGKANFTTIDPESIGQKAIFCLDNDGAKSFTDGAIHKAVERLITHGKEVLITIPNQINGAKTDFNDIACTKGVGAVRKSIDEAITYEQFSQKFKAENKSIGSDFAHTAGKNKEPDTTNTNSANSLKNIEQVVKTPQKSLDLEVNII